MRTENTGATLSLQTITPLLEAAPDGILLADGQDGRLLALNAAALDQLGYAGETPPSRLGDMLARTPELVHWLQAQVMGRGKPVHQAASFGTAGGGERWLAFSASRLVCEGRPCLMLITRPLPDQEPHETAFSRLNRLYAMLSKTNKAVIQLQDRERLFDEMCRIAVEEGGFRMAWVGRIDGNVVRPDSYAGAEQGYLRQIEVRVDDSDLARGPVGLAANEARVQCVNDALNDPCFLPWREAATERGFQALAALPVSLEGRVIGVFAMYSAQPHVFDDAMLDLLQSMSDDISFVLAHIEREKARRAAESRLRQLSRAVEQSASAVIITDTRGVIEYVNPRFTTMTGYSAREVLGLTTDFLAHDDQARETHRFIQAMISQGREWCGEYQNRRKNGETFWAFQRISPIRNEAGGIDHYVVSADDNTELHEAQETIIRLAYYDALTDLPNRRLLNDRLAHAIEACRRDGMKLAVLFLDLDGFKKVNDSLGHAAGDRLLQVTAQRMVETLRGKDTIARLGGDEFTVLITDVPEDTRAVGEVCEKIIAALRAPVRVGDHEVAVTTSIGVALYPDHAESLDRLMRNADMAMYHAKSQGRNNYQFYHPALYEEARQRLAVEQALRRAQERGELILFYQTQYDMRSGAPIGVEALIRWARDQGPLELPAAFLPVAEHSGLIQEIGDWVIRRALRDLKVLRQATGLGIPVAINLSTLQVRKPERLLDVMRSTLAETGLPAAGLVVEISEASIAEHPEQARASLRLLRELGVRICIDDFGTGHLALSQLRHVALDHLKIDASLIGGIPGDAHDTAIATALIALAEKMELNLLAEGIESQAQLDWLLARGCCHGQGFHFSHPASLDEVTARLAAQPR